MPTRKQRRRREKAQRHEWEYVEIDPESGEERPLDPAELKPEKPERKERKAQAARGKQQKGRGRTARVPQPPSWTRVAKRTALFAPLMALFIYYTQSHSKSGSSTIGIVLTTAILILFFAPFSYLVDSMSYRIWLKRQGEGPDSSKRR